jgi:hypothetical protein
VNAIAVSRKTKTKEIKVSSFSSLCFFGEEKCMPKTNPVQASFAITAINAM